MKNKMKTKMYYYCEKSPEFGVKELLIKEITYVASYDCNDKLIPHRIYNVISDFDIQLDFEVTFPVTYDIYEPYIDEVGLYVWDSPSVHTRYILSFDKERLVKRWEKEVLHTKGRLEERLKMLNEL